MDARGVSCGHAAVALFHHFVLRDDALECMAPVIATARPGKSGQQTK